MGDCCAAAGRVCAHVPLRLRSYPAVLPVLRSSPYGFAAGPLELEELYAADVRTTRAVTPLAEAGLYGTGAEVLSARQLRAVHAVDVCVASAKPPGLRSWVDDRVILEERRAAQATHNSARKRAVLAEAPARPLRLAAGRAHRHGRGCASRCACARTCARLQSDAVRRVG